MFNLVSTSTHKAFSAKPFPSWAAPSTSWCPSTPEAGCAFGFADLHKASLAHFSSLAQSLQPRPVHQDLLHGASSAHQCPSLWHPTETGPSAHPGTTPSQAQPICTTDHCASRRVPAPATPSKPMGLWHFPEASLPSQHAAQMGWDRLSRGLATDVYSGHAPYQKEGKALGIAHYQEKKLIWSTHENK